MVRSLGELGINLQKIISRLLANQNLMKLLYYTDKDPLGKEDISEEIIKKDIYEKLLKIVPRVGPKETAHSLVSIRVISGKLSGDNDQFQTIRIAFEVFVPLTEWFIKDSNLRPFAILSEIQNSLNNKVINGMGRMIGGDFDLNFLSEEISCYETEYVIVEYE